MDAATFIHECLLGGPGVDGYAYNADIYCADCAGDIVRELAPTVAPTLTGTDDPSFCDSERIPQPIFFGESDCAQHCAECGKYLYGPKEEDN